MVDLWVGEKKVLSGGTVLVFDNEPFAFQFDDRRGVLTVHCQFENDESTGVGQLVEEEGDDDSEYLLRFVNFNKPQGIRSKGFVEIGTYANCKLLFRYVVAVLDGYKTMHYTWYLDEEEEKEQDSLSSNRKSKNLGIN